MSGALVGLSLRLAGIDSGTMALDLDETLAALTLQGGPHQAREERVSAVGA